MLLEKYIINLKKGNKKNETKINIHLPVFGKVKEHCVFLNKEISKITKNQIDLSESSFMIPHITLYMGYIKDRNDFGNISNVITDYIQSFNPVVLSFSKPYIKNNENYVFVDVIEKKKIHQIKKELYNKIKPYVKDLHWDVITEPAHITIGYIENDNKKVEKLLVSYIINEELKISKINLSLTGAKGTCLGILKEFIRE